MEKTKKRIGFLSYWGWGKGIASVTLSYTKMLIPEYDVYILKQGNNKDRKEFRDVTKENVFVTEYGKYRVKPDDFRKWIKDNKLDAVVFNEYGQWEKDEVNLVEVAKEEGAKTYGYLIWEHLTDMNLFNHYDKIIAPTHSYEKFLRSQKIRNFVYIPVSVDLKEFPKEEPKINDIFTFFHPGGWGGYKNRKSTQEVISAFIKMNRKDTKLIISSQKKIDYDANSIPDNIEIIDKDLARKELIDLFYKSDAVVLPSKWETVGIPILESLAAGKPVITNNYPPMDEFIKEGTNGYLCKPDFIKVEGVSVNAAIVDEIDLKNKMNNVTNPILYPLLAKNSRHLAETLYSIENNKKYFLEFLEEDLK